MIITNLSFCVLQVTELSSYSATNHADDKWVALFTCSFLLFWHYVFGLFLVRLSLSGLSYNMRRKHKLFLEKRIKKKPCSLKEITWLNVFLADLCLTAVGAVASTAAAAAAFVVILFHSFDPRMRPTSFHSLIRFGKFYPCTRLFSILSNP